MPPRAVLTQIGGRLHPFQPRRIEMPTVSVSSAVDADKVGARQRRVEIADRLAAPPP